MGKIQVDDEFLYRHMPSLEEKIMRAYPKEEELTHEFSEEFERKMKKLIKRAAQKEKYGLPVTTGRRIAAAVAVGLIGAMIVSMTTKALNMEYIKTKLYEFVRTVYETHTESRYSAPQDKVGEFVPLYPAYIPEGYELTIEDQDETFLVLSYEDGKGDSIFIQQEQVIDGMIFSEDNEYADEENVYIQEWEGKLYYKNDGTIRARWDTSNCIYVVSATNLSRKDVLKICESLKQ